MMRQTLLALVAAMLSMLSLHRACEASMQPASETQVNVMRLIPPDAHAAFVIPNLKRTSDGITRLLEGMDRANLLMGARPIDHVKSFTGWNAALNEQGASAIVVIDAIAEPELWALIVPVTNADEFITLGFTNADNDEPNVRRTANGTIVHVRNLRSHVVLSEHPNVLHLWDHLPIPDGKPQTADGFLQTSSADAVVVLRPQALRAITQHVKQGLGGLSTWIPEAVLALPENVDRVLMTVQCDPLALIVRMQWQFAQHADNIVQMEVSPQPTSTTSPAELLPGDSFAMNLMVDMQALGGKAGAEAMLRMIAGVDISVPEWINQTHAAAISIAPGAGGALLSNAVIRYSADDASHVRSDMRAWMNRINRDISWQDGLSVADGITADAFAFRNADASIEPAGQVALEAMLFGTAGPRGLMSGDERTVTMTLAHRPALLAQFQTPARQFSDSPAVRIMRQWMPAQRDIEGYISLAELVALADQIARSLKIALPALPSFDGGLPPIGVAVDVQPHSAAGSAVFPSQVLAPIFDEAIRSFQQHRHMRAND